MKCIFSISCALICIFLSLPQRHATDIESLLESMSLEDQIGQMVQIDISVFMDGLGLNYSLLTEYFERYRIGSILNSPFSGGPIDGVSGWSAQEWRDEVHSMQTIAVSSGSKLPIIFGIDSIHGATFVANATFFPHQIGLAATFNRDIAVSVGQITSKDTRASGIPWVFSPVLGVSLHPLWSRFYETFGEDPYLVGEMGAALVEGYQRNTGDGGYPERLAACMKHFIAYSDPINGHDRSPVQLSDRSLKQLYASQFQAAVDAGVLTAMESYQEAGGVPMVSSRDYLKKLLRLEMNFTGFLVTDYREIKNLHDWHSVASTQTEAVRIVLDETSVDQSMVPLDGSFFDYALGLVNDGSILPSRIEESARRILEVKNQLGLLDNPIPPTTHPLLDTVGSDSDWMTSLEACRESITLLKNEDILPITDTVNKRILVTGPTCNSIVRQTGGWSVHWQGARSDKDFGNGVTVLNGLRNIYSNVEYIPGPEVDAENLDGVDQSKVTTAASAADVIVVCVGEETYTEKPGDIVNLDIASGQSDYIALLNASTTAPIILVIISGRPRLLNGCVEHSAVVIEGYLPGPMGGAAIAEVVSGALVPSGRLPFTYPKYSGSIPYTYNRKTNDMCIDPNDPFSNIACEVEWPFGSGLSFTTFEYSTPVLSTNIMNESTVIDVSVDVSNSGSLDANHTVMFFLFDMYRRVTPEVKSLKHFDKKMIAAGATTTFFWSINPSDLQYIGVDGWNILESGEFRVGVGHEVDCRENAASCAVFSLETSSSYFPVCDSGCRLWSSGLVCGEAIELDTCRSKCIEQNWDWNYVGCLEEYATGRQHFTYCILI